MTSRPLGPTKDQLDDIAHKANEQQRAYMGLPPTDEQELMEQIGNIMADLAYDVSLTKLQKFDGGPIEKGRQYIQSHGNHLYLVMQTVLAQKQRWQTEARIDELGQPHTFNIDSSFSDHYKNGYLLALSDFDDANEVRIEQLKTQLNNPQEKEGI